VNVQHIFVAPVTGGNYEWLTIDGKANVANESLVKNSIDHAAIVNGALRLADHTGTRRRR
jgi:hypothetical protein